MRITGLFLVVTSLLLPLVWYFPLMADLGFWPLFSQYVGATGQIAMAITLILATRIAGLEFVFGSLDRIYKLHKWLGIYALAAIFLHDKIDADIEGLGRQTWLMELGESFGGMSLDGLIFLTLVTVLTFIPYHLWRWTHKLMGVCFIFGVIHYILILKPMSLFSPLSLYLLAFSLAGIIAYIYTLLPFSALQGRHLYKIRQITEHGDIVELTLQPEGRGMKHRAGQFAFVQFDQQGTREVHPFSISKAFTEDRKLRFTIKQLGDYTKKLSQGLEEGQKVYVAGPYGHFRSLKRFEEIWIAAGVGITPFLAMVDGLKSSDKSVYLFYCVKNRNDSPYVDELEAKAKQHENLTVHIIETEKDGRLTADKIIQLSGFNLKRLDVYFCGPQVMREQLAQGLTNQGLPARRFHFEEFEIRTGVGLEKPILWIFSKALQRFPLLRKQLNNLGIRTDGV